MKKKKSEAVYRAVGWLTKKEREYLRKIAKEKHKSKILKFILAVCLGIFINVAFRTMFGKTWSSGWWAGGIVSCLLIIITRN